MPSIIQRFGACPKLINSGRLIMAAWENDNCQSLFFSNDVQEGAGGVGGALNVPDIKRRARIIRIAGPAGFARLVKRCKVTVKTHLGLRPYINMTIDERAQKMAFLAFCNQHNNGHYSNGARGQWGQLPAWLSAILSRAVCTYAPLVSRGGVY